MISKSSPNRRPLLIGAVVVLCLMLLGSPDGLFSWLISTQATAVFSLGILVVASYLARCYTESTNRLLDELREATRLVGEPNTSWDDLEDDFTQKAPHLAAPFVAFRRTIHRLNESEVASDFTVADIPTHRDFIALRSPRDYFSEDTTYRNIVNVPFFEAVPGMLTGLGIFFTFVGLACGVSLATDGLLPTENTSASIDPTDISALLASIGNLLQGAGQAFVTSIAGLASSLFFSTWIHRRENEIRTNLEKLNEAFECFAPTADAETLLLASARKTSRQEMLFRDLKENWELMAEKFTSMLGEEMRKASSAQTEELVNELRKLNESVTKFSTAQTEVITEETAKAMQQLVDMLSDAIKGMTDTFDRSAEGIRTSVAALDSILKTTDSTMQSVSEHAEDALGRMNDQINAIEARLTQGARALESSMNAMAEQSGRLAETVAEAGSAFKTSVETTSEGFDQTVNASASGFKEKVAESGNAFAETFAGAAQSGAQALRESAHESATVFRSAFTQTAEGAERFNRALEGSATAQRDIAKAYEDMYVKVARSSELLAHTLEETRLVTETLGVNREAFVKAMQELLENARETQDQGSRNFAVSAEKVSEVFIHVLETHKKLQESSEHLQSLLTEGLERFGAALHNLNSQLATNMSTADNMLGEAVAGMSEGLRRWTQYQSEQSNALERNTRGFTEAIDRVGDLVQAVDTSVRRIETAQSSTQKTDTSGNTDKVTK